MADFEYVANNLRESFRVIAHARAQGEVCELAGVSIASAGVTFQMFNTAFLSGPVSTEAELKKRILEPIGHFDSRGQEWAYWVCEDWIDPPARKRSRRLFENHGLRLSTELPGMIADRILPPVKPLPHIDVRRGVKEHDRVGSANHASRDICVKVECGNNWHARPNHPAHLFQDAAAQYREDDGAQDAAAAV